MLAELFLSLGCLCFAVNAMSPSPRVWVLYLVSAYMSFFYGFHWPATSGLVQQVVDNDDFSAVGSLSSFLFSTGMIAGPAIGGIFIARFGLWVTYLINFASFAVSLIALINLKDIKEPSSKNKELSPLRAIKEGLLYTFSRKELLGSYLVDFLAMIFGMPTALFPAIAQSFGGVQVLGMLYAAPAIGALAISLCSGWTKHITRYGAAISISALLWGMAIICFGLSVNIYFALFFLALAGSFDTISAIFRGIMWNESIPNNYRSRLAGIEMICCISGPKLGDTEAGLAAAAFGVTFSIVSGGVLCVISVIVCYYFLSTFWNYKSLSSHTESNANDYVK